MSREPVDAVVVGAGPNGLAAAAELARAGLAVVVLEAADTVGGGCRTAELTEPGFRHDVCAAIHPLAAASPFFRSLGLEGLGVELIRPPAALAHPFEDAPAALLEGSPQDTADGLGGDGSAYRDLMEPFVDAGDDLFRQVFDLRRIPSDVVSLARFGLSGLRSSAGLARSRFRGRGARALFGGLAAHAPLPLDRSPTAAFALLLGALAHTVGWPIVRGGSSRIVEALASVVGSYGGEIRTSHPVRSMADVPPARAVVFDLTPRQVLRIAGDRLPGWYRGLLRRFRYGPGVCKLDWALSEPIPWDDPRCARAGTVHVGGSLKDIVAAEAMVARGEHAERPFVLVAQQSLFDGSRAPAGRHTGWAYCHVPNGSDVDMTERIEAQIERVASGFRDTIVARSARTARELERYDANDVGGDINGGAQGLMQLVTRPTIWPSPYATPGDGIYLCSSSTPPGGGVHGMCGYLAARRVRRDLGA